MARAHTHAQRGSGPNGAGGGDATDFVFVFEYGTCAQKTDAGDDVGGYAVGTAAANFDGQNGAQTRAKADEDKRAQTCRFVVVFPLATNEQADEQRHQNLPQFVLQRDGFYPCWQCHRAHLRFTGRLWRVMDA